MTQTPPEAPPPETGFDPSRLRTVTAMRRSRDDRMIAGVCGGLARYLDIDPVVVRVVVAALTVVGGAGLVLYIAAWLLVPEDGADTSIVAARLPERLGEREVRTVGFVIAAVIVIGAVASAGPWSGWSAPWPLLGVAVLVWLMLRPVRRRGTPGTTTPHASPVATPPRRPSRGDGSLAWLTIGVGLIAAGILWLVDRASSGIQWPDYVALELAVVGLGVLVGTWRGNGRRLVPLGVLLGLVLLMSSQLPALTAGDLRVTPRSAAELEPTYVLGAGEVRVDLTEVADRGELDGRTLWIENGMGQVRVIVPDDVDLTVSAHVDFGHVQLFTREVGGWNSRLDWQDGDDADPDVRVVVDQSFGEIQVMHP
jgi:phage shock protein PspC (stress-responsive transcriptional regulator)